MEIEMEPRVKPLSFKIKGTSRESPTQKATHLLDPDLRNHWSTGTNTKEWILLELDEPCLLSHIRIYNKSVLEWEISAGLRYKPEAFAKVRPRCEAPRRDMMYSTSYTPCRYVRLSCLRGNPIAIFYIQLIGLPITGLEPEFQPVVNHLMPQIISHKQDADDMHIQLLQDITSRLVPFLPHLEADLNSFLDSPELSIRFLAMLAGPFYPILHIVNEREKARLAGNTLDSEASKISQPSSTLTVSSNFEPRRSRNMSALFMPAASSTVFRPDAVFMLLRKAYKDTHLGTVCRMASRILLKLTEPLNLQQGSVVLLDTPSSPDAESKYDLTNPPLCHDYSSLFGDDFQVPDDHFDASYLSVLDVGAVEEGVFHLLYSCASKPLLCSKLADNTTNFWTALPLVQALLPALRPSISVADQVDDSFSQWKQPSVQYALSQIVATSSSLVYRPLLHACAGYLSSFSPSHAKAASVLIDLCSYVLAPWMTQVIAKVDLALELLEDLLGVIQGARHSITRPRAALKYIILALSGHMDDVMAKYKDVKHQILFLVEMLDPFLDPAITPIRSAIAFGNVSSVFQEKQEHNCAIALKILHAALKKPAVLPSLESEWMHGSVTPSVLLSILEPHMQFPAEIDACKYASKSHEQDTKNVLPGSSVPHFGGASLKCRDQDETDGRMDVHDNGAKIDTPEDASLFFAPSELRSMILSSASGSPDKKISDSKCGNISNEEKHVAENNAKDIDLNNHVTAEYPVEFFNLHADCLQLMNYQDCDMRATEFRRLASDLHSQHDINPESHDASIDALLLAAECYVNPLFMMSFRDLPEVSNTMKTRRGNAEKYNYAVLSSVLKKNDNELETVAHLERRRDKIVLQILLEAAELDKNYQKTVPDGQLCAFYPEQDEVIINLSQHDSLSADAITLVRQNQALLCGFLVQRLQKGKHAMHEILLQSLLFLLQSATKLFCSPEHIIDIILGSAEFLHGLLTSYYLQCKEGKKKVDHGKVREVQRRWKLLQKLVIASSGGDDGPEFSVNTKNGFRFANLIPATAWIHKIPTFSSSASPLVRFLGWMAVSRNAKLYTKEQVLLASDLSHITYLLSIFSDELALVDNIVQEKDENNRTKEPVTENTNIRMGFELPGQRHADQSFQAIYPDISWFFPDMRKEFEVFGEIILEAVGLELKSLSAGVLPDILCWFSDLCSWPFLQKVTNQLLVQKNLEYFKGFIAKNAKAIILYLLEAIVTAHMEAMVHEIPRLVQVLVSLSRTSYCDVSFLNSILQLLSPIISFSLHKVSDEEKLLVNDSCLNFESLCFNELFGNLSYPNGIGDTSADKTYSRALTIFILASVFPDLSFQRKRETIQSLMAWAEFATSEQTTYFHDYLCAFETIMKNCEKMLFETLRCVSLVPVNMPVDSDVTCGVMPDNMSGPHFTFISDVCEVPEEPESEIYDIMARSQKVCHLSLEEAGSFSRDLEGLISKLNPTVELCWKIHHQLAEKLTLTSVQCFVYLRCLSSVAHASSISAGLEDESNGTSKSVEGSTDHWRIALEELANRVMVLQEDHCWEVASVLLDCLLKAPQCFRLDSMIGSICSALNKFSCNGPKLAWRLQTDKWLSFLFARGIHSLHDSELPLVSLLSGMLGHLEPEQRFVALRHLGRLVGQDAYSGTSVFSTSWGSPSVCFVSEPVLKLLVSNTWDHVVVVAVSDSSLLLRSRATMLLVDYIPFAERRQLQSLLASADSVLHNVGVFTPSKHDGPLAQLSLALLASVCLHSPAEDISLIPQSVWRHIENQATSRTEGIPGNLQKQACQALFRLKHEGEDAKENLKQVISGSSPKQPSPDFESTRESVLQVLANLTSVQSYFDLFSKNLDQKDMELEEAEMELDILQKEHTGQESSTDFIKLTYAQHDDRLQQIKNSIRSLEKSKLREEIIARRQKKLLMRRAHQKHLEETALREAELLHELDRERMIEVEREIERQQMLELERAKTRELRHHIDMEKEKLAQRELQRELEQVESGIRPSRREYTPSTNSNSRARERERFRERDNGRPSNESSSRAMGGSLHAETGTGNSTIMPSVVLTGGGSRSFAGQVPTILQSRDRFDDCGSNYEENFDGSKDSGDTGSIGDPDLVSAFEGQSQRNSSRGSKSRQGTERRERDGRREGKWERKH